VSVSSLNSEERENDLFVVDKVIAHRKIGEVRELKVKWRGYGSDENSWEPEADIKLQAAESVQEYWLHVPDWGQGDLRSDSEV
jgi:hypothetical protein